MTNFNLKLRSQQKNKMAVMELKKQEKHRNKIFMSLIKKRDFRYNSINEGKFTSSLKQKKKNIPRVV